MQHNPAFYKFLLEDDPAASAEAVVVQAADTPITFPILSQPTSMVYGSSLQQQQQQTTAPISSPPQYESSDYIIHDPVDNNDLSLFPASPPQHQHQQQGQQQQQPPQSAGTDFRRRRNWSERILNEMTGLLHVLSPVGKILQCSKSCLGLTGYAPEELVGRSFAEFLHVDDIDVFIRNFNRAFHSRTQVKIIYRFRNKNDQYLVFETIGHPRQGTQAAAASSFFAVAQPYPSRMGSLFDSFLELKMENEWLKQRLREVNGHDAMMMIPQIQTHSSAEENSGESRPAFEPNNSNTATASRLSGSEEIWSGVETPDFMTAFGPRSGATTSTGTKGEVGGRVGSDILSTDGGVDEGTHKDKWKRRKKQRGQEEYVCTDCGTASSPEWRKGPHGPKTLCNACGLRWAKRSKKKGSNVD